VPKIGFYYDENGILKARDGIRIKLASSNESQDSVIYVKNLDPNPVEDLEITFEVIEGAGTIEILDSKIGRIEPGEIKPIRVRAAGPRVKGYFCIKGMGLEPVEPE